VVVNFTRDLTLCSPHIPCMCRTTNSEPIDLPSQNWKRRSLRLSDEHHSPQQQNITRWVAARDQFLIQKNINYHDKFTQLLKHMLQNNFTKSGSHTEQMETNFIAERSIQANFSKAIFAQKYFDSTRKTCLSNLSNLIK